MKWIKEHKKAVVIIAVVLAAVLIVGLALSGEEEPEEAKEEVAAVERRTLMKTISATGSFIAADTVEVSTDTTGVEVLSVSVEVGDTVAPGDVIAVLDTEDLQERLTDAKEGLQSTNEQTQRTKDNANRNLEQAGRDRDEELANVDKDIQNAYDDWQTAETNYQDSVKGYEEAQKTLDAIKNTGDTTSNAYVTASSQVTAAKRQMENDRRTADSSKEYYDNLVSRRGERIQQIEDNYQNQVDSYNDTIDGTKDAGEPQQEQISDLEEQIAGAVVRATAGGLITAVNVGAGDTYNGGTLAVIDNVDSFDVTTEIDEYDINSIRVGQEVMIKTNATGEDELTGTVTKVSPIATGSNSGGTLGGGLGGLDFGSLMEDGSSSFSSGGSEDVTFTVTIHVETTDARLRIGMTAKLSIIEQKNEDVLSVPYNALQTDDEENYYVRMVTGKDEEGAYTTKKVKVTRGIESDYYTEILNTDLKEGDEILLPKPEGGDTLEDLIQDSGSMGGV